MGFKSKLPTELELELLNIIWRDGPCTVRHVRDTLATSRDLAFTSVLTTMKRMAKEGLLVQEYRRIRDGGTLYSARVAKAATLAQLLQTFARRIFGGSIRSVIQTLLDENALDANELKELREIVSAKKRRGR